MKKIGYIKIVGLLSVVLFMLSLMMPGVSPQVAAQEPADVLGMEGPTLVIIFDETGVPHFTPPPDNIEITGQSVNFSTIFNPASCSGTVTAWPTDAKNAFNYALGIWAALLNGPQTIDVKACYRTDMALSTLGSAGPTDYYRDFTGAGVANTWYPVTLANQLANDSLNGSNYEINANFNANRSDWYFGTDGNPGTNVDFVSVVLHEVGHGLGFGGSMIVDDGNSSTGIGTECNGVAGVGCWGLKSGYPFVYDRFTEDGSGTALINLGSYPQNSTVLGNALRGQVGGGVYFDGSNANAANGGSRVKLYTPSSWVYGSSYSHLDEIFNNTSHALMTYSIGPGEAEHNPGSVTLGIFKDMGWSVNDAPPAYKVYLPLLMGSPRPGYWSGSGNEFYVTTSYAVDNFAILVNVTGCGGYKITHLPPEPISNNQFSFSSDGFYASGSFSTNTTASGTTGLNSFYISGCGYVTGGPWSFSSTWQSSSQPTSVPATVVREAKAVVPVLQSDSSFTATPVEKN